MSPSSRASLLLVVALALLLSPVPPALAGEQADHHAWIAGRSVVPAHDHLAIRLDQTIFQWGTLWYSARVDGGPLIESFLVDDENFARFEAGQSFVPITGTASGPSDATSGLGAALPGGVYHLVLVNTGDQEVEVKWEVFLEPRLTGDPGATQAAEPSPLSHPALLIGLAGAAAVAVLAALHWWTRNPRGR